jgi:ABC-2 type transport system permease protein
LDLRTNLTGLGAMFRFSSKKLITNRRWVLVVLMVALVAVVMGYVANQEGVTLDLGSTLINTLILSFLLPVMSLIYGASMIRNEIDDRSITQVLTSPMDRRVSYLGYYLSLITVLALMLLILVVVGWSSYFLQDQVDDQALEMLVSFALLLVLGSIVYSSLFLAMGVLLKQPIYLGLLYVFVWESFVGSLPGAIGQYTIVYNLKVIGAELIPYGNITEFSGDAVISGIVLAILTVFLLVVGAFMFREKEVP